MSEIPHKIPCAVIIEGAIYFYDEEGKEIMSWNQEELVEEPKNVIPVIVQYLIHAWMGDYERLKILSGRY